MKRQVQKRVILAILPLALGVILAAAVGFAAFDGLARSTELVAHRHMANLASLREVRQGISRSRFVIARALVVSAAGRPAEAGPLWLEREAAFGRIDKALARLQARAMTAEETDLLTRILGAVAWYRAENGKAWAALRRLDLGEADRLQGSVAAWIDEGLYAHVSGLSDEQEEQAERLARQAAGAVGLAKRLLVAIVLLTGGAAAIVGWRLVRGELELLETATANQRLAGELREALDRVKTLTGLLPMCMYCKKIRDDRGSWNRIEAYLSSRTDARVSHGMCPDCEKANFPEPPPSDPGASVR